MDKQKRSLANKAGLLSAMGATMIVSFLVVAVSFALLSTSLFEAESARKAITLIGTLGFLLTAAAAYSYAALSWNAYWPKEIEGKPCLNCGKLKHHNNSFCSGECCKEHRGRAKSDKV